LTALPNIGETLAVELNGVGVATLEELTALGSVEAAHRIARTRFGSGHNLLFALEGAIRGVRWHMLPKPERARLKARFDEAGDR
jgi:DNA transformation protein